MKSIEAKRLSENATLPTRGHPTDAGLDLYASEEVVMGPGGGTMASTGVAMAIPPGHVGMIADRSSLGKKGIKTAGGIIDSDYRGEIKVIMRNLSPEEVRLKPGDRIAQMLILPIQTPAVEEVQKLTETERGSGGFGSTGR